MRPEELAPELGISAKHLRTWLRGVYRRNRDQWHKPWHLTTAQEQAARRHFAEGPMRVKSREGMRQLSLHLPEDLYRDLTRAAKQQGMSIVQLLRAVLRTFVETVREGGSK